MKTLEDLRKLREKVQAETNLRYSATTKVVVGMGTCGIAAGAREVMLKFIEKIGFVKYNNNKRLYLFYFHDKDNKYLIALFKSYVLGIELDYAASLDNLDFKIEKLDWDV